MTEFSFTEEHRRKEVINAKQRGLKRSSLFVLLLGPSATGKSTIIKELDQIPNISFEYVKPTITRPNRSGETDKISVTNAEFDSLEAAGKFVVVNELYGVRYGTPLDGILNPLNRGSTPILDYPLKTVSRLRRPQYDILKIYVYPQTLESWSLRVLSSGRNIDGRLEAGTAELGMLAMAGFAHLDIDISIVNADGAARDSAQKILNIIEEVVS